MQTAEAEGSPLRDKLILVIGARRSGTHWVGRIIGAHPAVVYLPSETFLFAHLDEFARNFNASMGSARVGSLYAERDALVGGLRSLCDSILTPWLKPGSVERILERTPLHTANLELISELYPDARVVHIIRDGRDVARSLAAVRWGPGSAVAGAEEWVRSVRQGRHPMKHYYEVRYETLLADPRGEIVKLFAELDLPADDAQIDAAVREAAVPVNHDLTMPAVTAEKWRTGLSAGDLADVEAVAGELLVELGYELGAQPGARSRPSRFAAASNLVAALRRGVAGNRGRDNGAPSNMELMTDAFEWAQHTVDEFVDHTRARRLDKARELLDPHVYIEVWMRDQEWDGRGEESVERLLTLLGVDTVFGRHLVRSDVHPALPAMTLVFAAQTEHGLESRTLVVHVRGRTIVRIAFYGVG